MIEWLKKASKRERIAVFLWTEAVCAAIDAGMDVTGSYMSTTTPRGEIVMKIKARKPRK